MKIKPYIIHWRNISSLQQANTPLTRWSVSAIGFIAIWLWFIGPLQQWNVSLEHRLSQQSKQAVRLVSLKHQSKSWTNSEQISAAVLESEINKALIVEASDTSAQAALQLLLQKLCSDSDVEISSQRLLPAEPEPVIGQKLMVALDLRGELTNILQVLDAISNADYILQIQSWTMKLDRKKLALAQVVIAGYRGVTVRPLDET